MTSRTSTRLAWTLFGVTAVCLVVNTVLAIVNTTGPDPTTAGTAAANIMTYIVMSSFAVAGLLVTLHRPGNAIGWLMLVIGLVWEVPTEEVLRYGVVTAPGSIPRPDLLAALSGPLWVPGIGLIGTFLLLLFPDGHLPSRRWLPVAWVSGLAMLVVMTTIALAPASLRDVGGYPFLSASVPSPLGVAVLAPFIDAMSALVLLVPLSIVACASSVVVRFRRARGLERQQLKWLAVSAVMVAAAYLTVMLLSSMFGSRDAWFDPAQPVWLAALQRSTIFVIALIPCAIGIAMLRHRLYDIDVIINRALVYGALTMTLAVIYIAGVLGVGAIVRVLSGQDRSSLAVAVSTLVVAGLFAPLRVRIQAGIDRRFYRRRYDGQQALMDFAVRVRGHVDLQSVHREVVATVGSTVQPASVFVWVRPPARARG